MPRRIGDDSGEFRPPRGPRRKGFPVWAILLIVGSVLVVGCGGVGLVGLWLIGSAPRPAVQPGQPAADQKAKVYDRDEFRTAVGGKTKAEVIETVGRPASTKDFGLGDNWWRYDKRTRDPRTGKIDDSVVVEFKDDHAFNVIF